MERYIGQTKLELIGLAGQAKIASASVAILGCGALGTVAADLLVRAGVGSIKIIDRDVVELANLQRQTLFTESDAWRKLPKAEAAAGRLREVNSEVTILPHVVEFAGHNALELLGGCDLVLDATDNYLARFTLNEAALALNLPWVYGGALAWGGSAGVFTPGGPCFRCMFEELPALGATEGCHLTGVFSSVTTIVAAWQVAEAVKIITGHRPCQGLMHFDLRKGDFGFIKISTDQDCPACKQNRQEFLGQSPRVEAEAVCGEDAVLVYGGQNLDLGALCERLKARGMVVDFSKWRLRLPEMQGCEIVIFSDGRALIYGTEQTNHAISIYQLILGESDS